MIVFTQEDLDKVYFTPFAILFPLNERYMAFNNSLTDRSAVCEMKPECIKEVVRRFMNGQPFDFNEFEYNFAGEPESIKKTMNLLFKESIIE